MSSQAVPLGFKPIAIQPIFSRGEDWIVTLTPTTTGPFEWPAGSTITAFIYPPDQDVTLPLADWTVLFEWPATIDVDQNIMFKGESADADQVLPKSLMRIRVSMPNSPTSDDYTWCKGTVVRND